MASAGTQPYDALLLVSFGGPEKSDDVVPFLQNVTRGRPIPTERLHEVGEHYFRFSGRSPINDQCRALKQAIEADLAVAELDIPVYWGNRNWHPYLNDTIARMRDDGIRRAAYFVTSAYSSYSSCRQYRENVAEAVAAAGAGAPHLDKLPPYFDRPGFVDPFVDATLAGLAGAPSRSRLVFVTHSIPAAMNDASGVEGGAYVAQHWQVAREVAARVTKRRGGVDVDLAYCSRSGPPHQPWLEPDINDHLTWLAQQGVPGVVVVPIGFVSDHMEVLYDLDTQAAQTADGLGLPMVRAATPGTDPRYAALPRALLLELAASGRGEVHVYPFDGGGLCGQGCCPPRPASTGSPECLR